MKQPTVPPVFRPTATHGPAYGVSPQSSAPKVVPPLPATLQMRPAAPGLRAGALPSVPPAAPAQGMRRPPSPSPSPPAPILLQQRVAMAPALQRESKPATHQAGPVPRTAPAPAFVPVQPKSGPAGLARGVAQPKRALPGTFPRSQTVLPAAPRAGRRQTPAPHGLPNAQAIQRFGNGSTSSNPFIWDVNGIGSYRTSDTGVQDILSHFGHPTQSVVKTYDDLASRVGFDVTHNKGVLTTSTVDDLHKHFDASIPLHLGFNPFLKSAWTDNLESYGGAKKGIALYSVMRSSLTGDLQDELINNVTLNDVLKAVSGRPSEVHHLLFKAHYPDFATTTANLMLTERSESEKIKGPGQHELMHMVASGNNKDKFKVLLQQYVDEYVKWLKARNIKLGSL